MSRTFARVGRLVPWFLPLIALTALSGVAPVVSALFHALVDTAGSVVRLDGSAFTRVLADRALLYSFIVSSLWAAASTFCTVAWAVPFAALLARRNRIVPIAVAALAVVWIVPTFIAAPIWRMFFHGNNGASLFSFITGVDVNLLLDPVASFAAALFVSVLRSLPPIVLVLYAGMKRTAEALLDAGRVEGATEWQLFRFVHYPAIRGYLFLLAVVTVIHAYREFTVPFLMTAGGPPLVAGITETYVVGATTTLEIYLYDLFLFSGDMRIPAAYSTLFLLFFLGAAICWFVLRRRVGYAFRARGGSAVPPVAGRRIAKAADTAWRGASWALFLIFSISALVFLYMLLWISLSRVDAVFIDAVVPPFRGFGNFTAVFADPGFFRSVANSALLAAATALVATATAFLAASAAVIHRLHGRRLFVSLQFFHVSGGMHALIPLFALVVVAGAVDTFPPVVLLYAASALPVGFYVIYAFLSDTTVSLYDEARMAGAGPLTYALRILIPLSRPALVNVALLAWITAWNGFLIPLVFLTSENRFPASVYLHSLVGTIASGSPRWGTFAAGSVVNVLFLSILFVASRRPLQANAMAEIGA